MLLGWIDRSSLNLHNVINIASTTKFAHAVGAERMQSQSHTFDTLATGSGCDLLSPGRSARRGQRILWL